MGPQSREGDEKRGGGWVYGKRHPDLKEKAGGHETPARSPTFRLTAGLTAGSDAPACRPLYAATSPSQHPRLPLLSVTTPSTAHLASYPSPSGSLPASLPACLPACLPVHPIQLTPDLSTLDLPRSRHFCPKLFTHLCLC